LGIIGVAVVIVQGKINIAVSSAAPTPVSVRGLDLRISEADAVAAVRKIISPISDVRCTKEYREFMTDVFVKRLLAEVRG
jgi:carbon-monoxide dehydrogenase medium subunit